MRARKLIVLFLFLTGLLFATWIAAGQQTRRIDDLALRIDFWLQLRRL